MSYLVLARKYRPQTFDDLVGQEHVARTLGNAIEGGRVAHAFLFTGVRGVGKTTSARLLAKCLNCLGEDGKATGPRVVPCNVCAACKEIAAGNDIDVQEIDGASYNGVDEVRRLQEGLAFRPARDRFKIFIVDEVHMLSNAAWNAFLKTLEEPPPHVKFIFATTEVHKVPVTILSRCQRYDFKLIGTQVIAKRLEEVLGNEKITAEPAAVAVLAREAAGSMRDAMSLLDQVIAFSGAELTAADVTRVLGVADRKVLHDLCRSLLEGDAAAALRTVDGLATQGFDLVHVAKDLLASFRNLVVAKVSGEAGRELLDLADEEVADVLALAQGSEVDDLLRLFNGFSRAYDDVARSGQARAALEMTLVRLARRPALLPLDELLSRLGDLERRLGGAAPPPRGGGGGSRASATTHVTGGFSTHAPGVVERTRGALALAPAPVPVEPSSQTALKVDEATPVPPSAERDAPTPPVVRAGGGASPVEVGAGGAARVDVGAGVAAPAVADLGVWRAVLAHVREERPPMASVFEHAVVLELGPERVRVGYTQDDFLGSQAAEPEAVALLARAARAHFGAAVEVRVEQNVKASKSATVFAIDSAQRQADLKKARAAVEGHPMVKAVVELFGAEIREVKLPKSEE